MDKNDYISSGAIESYVLGLSDAQEVAEIEQLSLAYPEIKQAILEFEISLEAAAVAQAATPATATKAKLIQALQTEFNIPVIEPVVPIQSNNPPVLTPVVPIKSWYKYAVAASILLIASSSLNIYFYSKYKEVDAQNIALLEQKSILSASNQSMQVKYNDLYDNFQITNNPNIIKVILAGTNGNATDLATVFWDSKTKDVYLLQNQLPKAPAGKQYQLWALVDGKPVDAGTIGICNGVCKLKNIEKAQAFAITLEKEGGSPTPDLTQLHVLGKLS